MWRQRDCRLIRVVPDPLGAKIRHVVRAIIESITSEALDLDPINLPLAKLNPGHSAPAIEYQADVGARAPNFRNGLMA